MFYILKFSRIAPVTDKAQKANLLFSNGCYEMSELFVFLTDRENQFFLFFGFSFFQASLFVALRSVPCSELAPDRPAHSVRPVGSCARFRSVVGRHSPRTPRRWFRSMSAEWSALGSSLEWGMQPQNQDEKQKVFLVGSQ